MRAQHEFEPLWCRDCQSIERLRSRRALGLLVPPSIELRGALFFCLPSKESAAACSIPQAALLCRGIANPVQRAVPTASADAKVSLTPH
jgi:hypothetical protein